MQPESRAAGRTRPRPFAKLSSVDLTDNWLVKLILAALESFLQSAVRSATRTGSS
jgi:hypothetical protein